MIGKIISHFKVLEKLGEGGMGDVYRAEDTNLDRIVAVKFLPVAMTRDKDMKTRFIHEAKAASSLQHNNIYTIHEIDETEEEQLFIVMDCYEGKTVEEKTKRGPLEVEEALDIAIQIAQGLDKAHKKKIIHRDIKSANIIVTTDGVVKIVDFGIAKLAGQTRVTKDGTSLGTVSYMSPEQTLGKEVDHRTDIWSLGVVLYEMLTGLQPFQGDYEQAVVYSIMNEEPEPPTGLRTGIPMELERIVTKTLAKDPNERYQHLDEIITELKNVQDIVETLTNAGSDAALSEQPSSIAVLPFLNLSNDPENEYFSDGLAEDLLNLLTKITGLRVASRTSSFVFKGKSQDIREIGRALNVGTVLEGSVRKVGNHLRITAQLINVSDGFHLWSEKFDRELKDVFAIQDEITENIAKTLKVLLTKKEKDAIEIVHSYNHEAYEYYLQGRTLFHQWRKQGFLTAVKLFKKAIKIDPKYAVAHGGIADCYALLFMYWNSDNKFLKEAQKYSSIALDLAPNLSEVQVSKGLAYSIIKNYEEAEKSFQTAIKLSSTCFDAYYWSARTQFVQGNIEQATRMYEKAIEYRPDDFQSQLFLASIYNKQGNKGKARSLSLSAIKNAEQHLRLNPDNTRALYLGAGALIMAGFKERGLEWANRALEIEPDEPAVLYNVACIYSISGKIEEALDILEKWVNIGFGSAAWIKIDPDFDPLRDHPRFQKIVAKYSG
ncbi:MAG: protein kinase [Candidatus Neomarinimicrobiota bacterium]